MKWFGLLFLLWMSACWFVTFATTNFVPFGLASLWAFVYAVRWFDGFFPEDSRG